MKQLFSIVLLFCTLSIQAQFRQSIFSKNPVIHLENWQQKRVYFGFFLGLNSYDFKFDYNKKVEDIQVKKTTGFNVGLVADLRLHEYINLRFEPGLYYTKRTLNYLENYFVNYTLPRKDVDRNRELNSTYIHLPLLFKFSSLRTGNIRPYLVGGFSTTLNLSSNSKAPLDNFDSDEKGFRLKAWSPNYELGFGIDIFSEYFIFSPSVRGVFGLKNEIIPDNQRLDGIQSPWTGNIETMKTRGLFINFTFH